MGIMINSAIWMVIVLILTCFICACATTDVNTGQAAPDGAPQVADRTPREGAERATLADALGALGSYLKEAGIGTMNVSIHMVHGSALDLNGTARSWMIGVEADGAPYIMTYLDGEWRYQRWSEPFGTPAIRTDEIMDSGALYYLNSEKIRLMMEESGTKETEFDLTGERLTISVFSGRGWIQMVLDPRTGEVLVFPE